MKPAAMRVAQGQRQQNRASAEPQNLKPSGSGDFYPHIGLVSRETCRDVVGTLFFRQDFMLIFIPPGQPGYGDKRTA
jgi:hypothetical protein